jgi:hypothetical protein
MVFCYDLDGKRLWSTQTHLAEGGGHFACIASLLLVRNVLVCDGGGSDYWSLISKNKVPDGAYPPNPQTGKFAQWVVGLDAETGNVLWDVGPLNAGGYSATGSPVPVIVNDGKE